MSRPKKETPRDFDGNPADEMKTEAEMIEMEILHPCWVPEGVPIKPANPLQPRKMQKGEKHRLPADHARLLHDKGWARRVWE